MFVSDIVVLCVYVILVVYFLFSLLCKMDSLNVVTSAFVVVDVELLILSLCCVSVEEFVMGVIVYFVGVILFVMGFE